MPELPDVETEKTYLEATALHQKIERTHVSDDRILKDVSGAKLARTLKGRSLETARRHGKYLFASVSSGPWLVFHFGMTGSLAYSENHSDDRGKLDLTFTGGAQLVFKCPRLFGWVGLTENPEDFIAEHELGPDALADDLDSHEFAKRLANHSGNLKSTLMNQSVVAGIGNIYSDELLFQCGLHPEICVDETDDETIRMFTTMRRILRTATRHHAKIEELPDHWLLPHRNAGEPCPKCGTEFETTDISGRTACFCPKCQRRP